METEEKYNFDEKDKKENSFVVPDNYFEKLPGRIQNRITSSPSPYFVIVRIGFAVALIAGLVFTVIKWNENQINEKQIASIDAKDILASDHIYEIDESTLFENIDEDELTVSNTDKFVTDEKTEIEDYLIEENIDINSIINEL